MANRAERRARRSGAPRPAPRRRSSVPTLLIVLAVFAIVLFAVASFAAAGGTPPSPTP